MVGKRDEGEGRARYLLGLYLLSDLYKDECAAELLRDAVYYVPELTEARVALGIAYCRLDRFGEMLDEFREAVAADAAAVRKAVRESPDELEGLRRLLHPRQEIAPAPGQAHEATIPSHYRESWALVGLGMEQIGAGRDAEAVAALEAALRLDETNRYGVALLAMAYFLCHESRGVGLGETIRSVLWEAEPKLAELLFEGLGRDP